MMTQCKFQLKNSVKLKICFVIILTKIIHLKIKTDDFKVMFDLKMKIKSLLS